MTYRISSTRTSLLPALLLQCLLTAGLTSSWPAADQLGGAALRKEYQEIAPPPFHMFALKLARARRISRAGRMPSLSGQPLITDVARMCWNFTFYLQTIQQRLLGCSRAGLVSICPTKGNGGKRCDWEAVLKEGWEGLGSAMILELLAWTIKVLD